MAYLRTKKIKNNTYYYLVEGKRDEEGNVKQKVLQYLGTAETILKNYKELNKLKTKR